LSKAQFKVVAGALRNRKYLKEVIQERGLIDKDNKQLNNIFNLGLNHYKNNNKFPTNIVMEDLLEDKIDNEGTLEKYINLVEKIYSADVNDVDFYHFLSKAKDEKKDRLMQTGLSKVIDTLEFGKREQAEKEVFRLAKLLRKSDTGSRVKRSSIIDDDYVDYLTLLTLRKKRQRFSNWHKNKSNPFFPNVDEIPSEYRKIVKQNNRDLKELKIRDFSFIKSGEELSIKRKFKLAGLEYVYESIYDLNSSDAHNDLSSLTSKHLLEKDNAELVISSENKDGLDSIKPHIITLSGLLINALEEVFIFFNNSFFI
jgi:hypothetical protein